jgi:hypothetical protein
LDYYYYSMDTKTLNYVVRLESGLTSEVNVDGSIRFKKPWLAYTCDKGTYQLILYNTSTTKKVVVQEGGTPLASYFSSSCKYLLISGNDNCSVYDFSSDSICANLTRTSWYYNAFYLDELTGRVFANFFSKGTNWFNIKTGAFDSIYGKPIDIGIFQRVIDNGNAFLFNCDTAIEYCFIDDILSDSIVLRNIGVTFVVDDVDFSTGNVCGTQLGNLTIGNRLGKFETEVVNHSIREEK